MKFEFKKNSAFLPFVGGIFEIYLLEPVLNFENG